MLPQVALNLSRLAVLWKRKKKKHIFSRSACRAREQRRALCSYEQTDGHGYVLPREGVSRWIGRPTEERAGRPQCPVFVGLERTRIARRGQTHLFRVQFIIFPSERRRKLVSLLFCRLTAKFRPRIVSTYYTARLPRSHKSADRNACFASREERRRW